jgi:hypothetical protein
MGASQARNPIQNPATLSTVAGFFVSAIKTINNTGTNVSATAALTINKP